MRTPLLLILTLAGCDGFFKGEDTGVDSTVPADDSEVTVDTQQAEACGELTQDTTWTAEMSPITLTCDVRVLDATLTIEAGAVVLASSGASLDIGDDEVPGALVVAGSADAPVRFSPLDGDVRGGWSGLLVHAEGEASIRWAELSGAGGGEGADLLIEGAEVLVESVQLSDSSGVGLLLRQGGRLHPDSASLRVSGNESWAAIGPADVIHSLPAGDSEYTGNTLDAVAVEAATVEDAVEWEDLGVPYAVLGNVELEGVASAPAELNVTAGVRMLFDGDRSIRVSRRGGEASLRIGEASGEAVYMGALDASEPGFWGGLLIFDGAQDIELRNLLMEYAGSAYDGSVYAETDVDVLMQDVDIERSSAAAVLFTNGAGFHADSADLVFTNNEGLPVVTGADQTHTVPLEDYTGNARDGVGVTGTTVPVAVSWPDHGIPYVVDGDVKLEGIAVAPAILTIAAGTELRFTPDSAIFLSQRTGASGLVVEGEQGNEVLMTADGAAVPGAWSGIGAYNGVVSTDFRLEHTVIEYAGDEAFDAAIYMEAGAIEVQDVVVRESRGVGMTLTGDARFVDGSMGLEIYDCDSPMVIPAGYAHTIPPDADLTGNFWDYLYVRNDTQIRQSVTWRPVGGVDWWIEDTLNVGNGGVDGIVLTLEAGLVLRFEAETELRVGVSSTNGTAAIDARGTASQPVVLTAAQAYHPGAWGGLSIGPECGGLTQNLEHVEVRYAAMTLNGCAATFDHLSLSDAADIGLSLTGANALITADTLSVSDAGDIGLRVRSGADLTVTDLSITDSGAEGLYLVTSSVRVYGSSSVSGSGGVGVLSSYADLVLDGVTVEFSGDDGLQFSDPTGDDLVLIDSSVFRDNAGDGVEFAGSGAGVTLQDSELRSNGGWGIRIDPSDAQPTLSNVTYSNNTLGDIGQ